MKASRLVVVTGPTAVGKTAVSIRLAHHFNTEIISADSRQVFREMIVGTARPSLQELAEVHHHLVGHRSIHDPYDAAMFAEEATDKLTELFKSHQYLILCGGSGLYIKALLEGFDEMPPVAPAIREQGREEYQQKGLSWLQDEILRLDPVYFASVDRQNPQRLLRALEVIRATGKPFSDFHRKAKKILPFEVVKIGLELERDELYQRSDRRVDAMVAHGLFKEVEQLVSFRKHNALQTVGYQEVFEWIEGKVDREQAILNIKQNTRHYAKRQLTWFRKDKEIRWFHPDDWDGILQALA